MKHKGFTLIEVALFLAVTGMLFVGIVAGTNNSIYQQRFMDAVQNYAEFLRTIYSEVSNPQSVGDGRSETAIYGKMVSFGQSVSLDGEEILEGTQKIYVYDVVGDVVGTADASSDVTEMLKTLKANVVKKQYGVDGKTVIAVDPAGTLDIYSPRWGAGIETTAPEGVPFTGTILVVRHPKSGTINTLYSPKVIEVNQEILTANEYKNFNNIDGLLLNQLSSFDTEELDFCIDPKGLEEVNEVRRDIRLVKNARNGSGVEIIELDAFDVVEDGAVNRCRVKE